MTEERRSRVLSEHDLTAIAERVAQSRVIPDQMHAEHHEFIGEWIRRTRRRAEMCEKIKTQVGGWAVITLLAGIGYAVWEWVRGHLR